MKITKLNTDSSWLWEINGLKILVDPWFSKSQVDFHPWFSKQFHLDIQPEIAELPHPDYLFISHPFSDHCDKETLLLLSPEIPVICLPSIQRKIQKWGHFHQIISLNNAPFQLEKISKTHFLDLVHHAYLFSDGLTSMCYAPHGTRQIVPSKQANVLLTTVTTYQLPFFLGGTVNLGLEKALLLGNKLQVQSIISTHDEAKIQKGIVATLSQRTFSNTQEILFLNPKETFEI